MIPEDLKYTKEHEWVRIKGNKAIIGITDHAQSELGDITFIELPSTGSQIRKSESIATVESVKAASDIYAPLSGKITAINQALEDAPETINQSPYDKGWVCHITIDDSAEEENLMSASQYEEYLKESK